MQQTLSLTYLGRSYSISFESDVDEDLSKFGVGPRINGVLQRELQRCAEITAVALQDQVVAAQADAETRERKARGEVLVKGPAMVLAAGTKAVSGRVVLEAQE